MSELHQEGDPCISLLLLLNCLSGTQVAMVLATVHRVITYRTRFEDEQGLGIGSCWKTVGQLCDVQLPLNDGLDHGTLMHCFHSIGKLFCREHFAEFINWKLPLLV